MTPQHVHTFTRSDVTIISLVKDCTGFFLEFHQYVAPAVQILAPLPVVSRTLMASDPIETKGYSVKVAEFSPQRGLPFNAILKLTE